MSHAEMHSNVWEANITTNNYGVFLWARAKSRCGKNPGLEVPEVPQSPTGSSFN